MIDTIESLKKEVLEVIHMEEFPDCYHIDEICEGHYNVFKYYDSDEENMLWGVCYCQGEFVLLEYHINWDYEWEKDWSEKEPGLFL